MDKNKKAMALALMDLCAFACSQEESERSREEFEESCRAAEKCCVEEVETYRYFVNNIYSEASKQQEADPHPQENLGSILPM